MTNDQLFEKMKREEYPPIMNGTGCAIVGTAIIVIIILILLFLLA